MTALQLNDETAFSALVERHRRELQVHCYRMLGSFEESEDLTQETFLRAWRSRETYAGRASLRAWLYRIATNACLDALERRPRTPARERRGRLAAAVSGRAAGAIPADDDEPDAEVVARETIELAFMVAIQHLPPRPRAVLILRDVLGWRAQETRRAARHDRRVGQQRAAARAGGAEGAPAGAPQRVGGRRGERGRAGAAASATSRPASRATCRRSRRSLHEDLRFSMPPGAGHLRRARDVVGGWVDGGFGDPGGFGEMRCLVTHANLPARGRVLRPGPARSATARWRSTS